MNEMKVTTTGNTTDEAENKLKQILNSMSFIKLTDKKTYGNFELGYKVIQYFEPIQIKKLEAEADD